MKFSALSSLCLVAAISATCCQAFVFQTPLSASTATTTTGSKQRTATTSLQMATELKQPGTAKLDTPWNELGFEFRPTNSHLRITYKDGKWGKSELVKVSY